MRRRPQKRSRPRLLERVPGAGSRDREAIEDGREAAPCAQMIVEAEAPPRRPRRRPTSGRSAARCRSCRARTARRCSPAARRRRWRRPRSAPSSDEQKIDALIGEHYRKFMLHYNFPPYSVGEVKPLRGPSRREVGHGALAERALSAVLPDERRLPVHDPHRVRDPRVERLVVDGHGVRRQPVDDGRRRADQGAGGRHRHGPDQGGRRRSPCSPTSSATRTISATWTSRSPAPARASPPCRWTSRSTASPRRSCARRCSQAREGRLHILEVMNRTHADARAATSRRTRRASSRSRSAPDKIRDIIGPGGKVIRGIVEETGCKIDIEDDGTVFIASSEEAGMQRAIEIIEGITMEAQVGKIYKGKVAPHRRLRRLRRDHARHRRAAAHLADRTRPRAARLRRAEGRRRDPGQGAGDRPLRQDPPQPQGGDGRPGGASAPAEGGRPKS